MNYYKNLKELEKDLRVHQLETEIAEEKIKLHLKIIKKELVPRALFSIALGRLSNQVSLRSILRRFSGEKQKKTANQ